MNTTLSNYTTLVRSLTKTSATTPKGLLAAWRAVPRHRRDYLAPPAPWQVKARHDNAVAAWRMSQAARRQGAEGKRAKADPAYCAALVAELRRIERAPTSAKMLLAHLASKPRATGIRTALGMTKPAPRHAGMTATLTDHPSTAQAISIRRAIEIKADTQLTRADLLTALRLEHEENDLFPATDLTEDWLKLTDFDPENVVKLGPVRARKAERSGVV